MPNREKITVVSSTPGASIASSAEVIVMPDVEASYCDTGVFPAIIGPKKKSRKAVAF